MRAACAELAFETMLHIMYAIGTHGWPEVTLGQYVVKFVTTNVCISDVGLFHEQKLQTCRGVWAPCMSPPTVKLVGETKSACSGAKVWQEVRGRVASK